MAIDTKHLTLADLEATPEDDGNRYEIIAGAMVVSAAPIWEHQAVSSELNDLLKQWVKTRKLGRVFYAPVDVMLGPNDIVEPDLIFLPNSTCSYLRNGRCFGPPDLVVEIHSPTTRRRDQIEKLVLYARSKIPEYWMADLEARTIEILTLRRGLYHVVEPNDDGTVASVILSGLTVKPEAIFAVIDADLVPLGHVITVSTPAASTPTSLSHQ